LPSGNWHQRMFMGLPVPRLFRSALQGGYADAAGEGGQAGQGLPVAGTEEVFGDAMDRWPVAYFGGADLVPLAGAGGCAVGSPLEKAGRDLRALLYADGIHDSLYRAVGRAMVNPSRVSQQRESA
jgi:hypothetical protein